MNEASLKKELFNNGYEINENQLLLLKIYYEFLIEYNKQTNLTSIIKEEEVYLKHFYDSSLLIRKIDFNKINTLVDVGTGAGFPGVVIKILYPHIHLILIDSNGKKIKFLELLCQKLNLNNIDFHCIRSEIFAKNNIDKYDCVVARAVKQLNILTEICLPLVKVGGFFGVMKANINNEISISEEIIKTLGGTIVDIDNLTLPFEGSVRNNIIIKKIKNTPPGYPRDYSKIIKKH